MVSVQPCDGRSNQTFADALLGAPNHGGCTLLGARILNRVRNPLLEVLCLLAAFSEQVIDQLPPGFHITGAGRYTPAPPEIQAVVEHRVFARGHHEVVELVTLG